ncbi:MAG: oligosaccharide flippase family protein, partial [Verrucomicrobiota bacterium]
MQKRALHAVGANFLWLAGERLLRIVLGLFILGYVARYLGKVQFGLLSYASSMTAIFAVIANAGIDGIVIRELVKYPEKKGEILGSAWGIKFFGAILIVVGFGVMAVVRRQSEFFVLAVVISLSMLPQSFEVIDLWFQKLVQSKFTVKAKTFAYIFSALTKILLIVFHAPLIFFCAALAMDVVFYALSLVLVYSRTGETLQSWRFRLPVARELLRDGWPLIISGVVVAL